MAGKFNKQQFISILYPSQISISRSSSSKGHTQSSHFPGRLIGAANEDFTGSQRNLHCETTDTTRINQLTESQRRQIASLNDWILISSDPTSQSPLCSSSVRTEVHRVVLRAAKRSRISFSSSFRANLLIQSSNASTRTRDEKRGAESNPLIPINITTIKFSYYYKNLIKYY